MPHRHSSSEWCRYTNHDDIKESIRHKKGVSLTLRLLRDSREQLPYFHYRGCCQRSSCRRHGPQGDCPRTCRGLTYRPSSRSFLQNDNNALVPLDSYVRDVIFPSTSVSSSPLTHPVNAYCGAGLFVPTPASHFKQLARIGLFADQT